MPLSKQPLLKGWLLNMVHLSQITHHVIHAVRQAAVTACSSQVDELVASTVAEYGGVDILVANAGIVRAAEFLDMSEQDFDDVIRVNLKGTFLVRRPMHDGLRHPLLNPVSTSRTI